MWILQVCRRYVAPPFAQGDFKFSRTLCGWAGARNRGSFGRSFRRRGLLAVLNSKGSCRWVRLRLPLRAAIRKVDALFGGLIPSNLLLLPWSRASFRFLPLLLRWFGEGESFYGSVWATVGLDPFSAGGFTLRCLVRIVNFGIGAPSRMDPLS